MAEAHEVQSENEPLPEGSYRRFNYSKDIYEYYLGDPSDNIKIGWQKFGTNETFWGVYPLGYRTREEFEARHGITVIPDENVDNAPEIRPEEVEQPVTNEVEAAEVIETMVDEHGFDRLDYPLTVVKDEVLIDDETAEVDGPVLTEVCTRDRHEAAQESADGLPADEATDSVEEEVSEEPEEPPVAAEAEKANQKPNPLQGVMALVSAMYQGQPIASGGLSAADRAFVQLIGCIAEGKLDGMSFSTTDGTTIAWRKA